MAQFLKNLNPDQEEAVTHGSGPLIIIAGAGTGKTKAITHRIAYLISSKKAKPEDILAVTFTEKAASEMEERVDILIPYSYSFVEISTFNSFGERVLRDYGIDIGYPPDFKLLDEVEQAIFLREHLFEFPLDYYRPLSSPTRYIQDILSVIKRLKQEDIKPQEFKEYAERLEREALDDAERERALKHLEMARVYRAYQDRLESEGMIDFEDQVVLVMSFRTQITSSSNCSNCWLLNTKTLPLLEMMTRAFSGLEGHLWQTSLTSEKFILIAKRSFSQKITGRLSQYLTQPINLFSIIIPIG